MTDPSCGSHAVPAGAVLLRRVRPAGAARSLDLRWADGVITALGELGSLPGETVVDLDDAYLVPGLIDAHVHLSRGAVTGADSGSATTGHGSATTGPAPAAAALAHARATLAAGVTAVRDLGAQEGGAAGEAAGTAGCRVVAAGQALTRTGCYGGFLGVCVADGAELEARAWQQIEAGARVLKVILTGPVDFVAGTASPPHFDEADLRRVVAVGRRAGVPVAVHANGHQGVSLALRVGADSLEHGILLAEDDLRMMAGGGTVWVPTLTPLFNLRRDPRWPGLEALFERHVAAVARGAEIGVTVVAGSDAGSPAVPHPSLFTELALLRRSGLSAGEVSAAAGSAAAALLGLGGGYGRLEVGARTDLVWFATDPFAEEGPVTELGGEVAAEGPGPPLGMLLA